MPHGTPPARRILIVDDDDALRAMLRQMLEAVGFQVTEVSDARTAIETIAVNPPDLVLTDIYMPVADGFELLNWMRMQDQAIPVIAMSGSGSGKAEYDQLAVAERLGAVAVIDKPFRHSQLVETIDRVLADRAAPKR